jgi:hypothetical protein
VLLRNVGLSLNYTAQNTNTLPRIVKVVKNCSSVLAFEMAQPDLYEKGLVFDTRLKQDFFSTLR